MPLGIFTGVLGLLVGLSSSPAYSQGTRLEVVSADKAPITAALVSVTCGAQHTYHRTDDRGMVDVREDDECTVAVTAPRFTPWQGSLRQLRTSPIVVLAIAPFLEQVTVTGVLPSPWASLASARMSSDGAGLAGWDAELMMRLARARAGTGSRQDRFYVDGMPADRLPPGREIAEIRFNADPFSVLFSDSDQNIVEVTTMGPDRRVRWSASAVPFGLGGRNPLARRMRGTQSSVDASLNAPVPRTPMAFSVALSAVRQFEQRPVFSQGLDDPERVDVESSRKALVATLVGRWGSSTRVRASVQSFRAGGVMAGVGGIVRPAAARANAIAADEVRAAFETSAGSHVYRTGFTYSGDMNAFDAQSSTLGIAVMDALVDGGAEDRSSRSRRRRWMWTTNVAERSGTWLAGGSVAVDALQERLEPNAAGRVLFGSLDEYHGAIAGAAGGSLTRMVGESLLDRRSTTGAAFAERQWLRDRSGFRVGLRADYQSGDGVVFSPRVSALARNGKLSARSAAGAFRQNWSNETLALAERFSQDRTVERVLGKAVFSGDDWRGVDMKPLRSAVADNLARPLSWLTRNTVEVTTASSVVGVEHTWTAGMHKLGSRRVAVRDGWIDVLESNRALWRHQLHVRGEHRIGGLTFVASYQWVHSRDNGDDAFSFPELQSDLGREWARSAGQSPHNWTLVADLPPLLRVEAAVVLSKRSSAPFNIRTGLDAEKNHLYTDRGCRLRNAGNGPGYESLDAYAHRRVTIRLPKVQLPLEVALFAENLLGKRNISGFGTLVSSPYYGVPLAALPGRTIRLSVRVAP